MGLPATLSAPVTETRAIQQESVADPGLRLVVDGQVLLPVSVDQGLYVFRLTGPTRQIRLLSRAMVPALQAGGSPDGRRLGVGLRWLRLHGGGASITLRHDYRGLDEGFHAAEADVRWTDGFALLPSRLHRFLSGEITAEVMIACPGVQYPEPRGTARPRALVIDETVPEPDHDAGSNVVLEHMRLLQSLGYAITFLPANLAAPSPYAEALAEAGIELAAHPFYAAPEHLIALRGPSFALAYVHRVTVAERVMPMLRRYAPQARILFNNADLHFLRLLREAELTGSETLRQEAEAMRAAELRTFAAADAALLCNAQEMDLLRGELPYAGFVYLPWVWGPRGRGAAGFAERRGVMFLGGFAHRPNADAVIWFATTVMPLLRPLVLDLVLHVYGHGMPEAVRALAGPDVVIEGYVADLAEAFARHRVSVAPLRFGAGFKGKLAESLAHGVPMVASSVAVEGSGLVDGEHLLVADGAGPFAHAVARLYNTPALWRQLATEGHRFALAAFSEALGRQRLRQALALAGLPDSA
jgi:glycosyltransferase involved in cell wall biosynthesis